MSAIVEALDDATPEQRAELLQYASHNWFDMQPIFRRTSHLMTCSCGKLYIEHPLDRAHPYLNRLCNGDLVKL